MTGARDDRAWRADRRREQILDAAARIFAEKGYHEAGIADIATALNIGHGTFYRYFENKQDIVAQAVDLIVRRMDEAILEEDPEISGTLSEFRAQLERIYLRLFAVQDRNPHFIRFLYRQATETTRLGIALDGFLDYTGRLLRNGMAKGFLRRDVDVEAAGHAIAAVLYDVLRRSAVTPTSADLRQRWMSTGTRLLLDGLQQPAGDQRRP